MSQPERCSWRVVRVARFCGPTARWQAARAGLDPNVTDLTQQLADTCTCDRCTTDGDCHDAPGGRCLDLESTASCQPTARHCVYPNGPCASCPSRCLYGSDDALTCSFSPPPP